MGKKIKKKGRNPLKEKRVASNAQKKALEQSSVEAGETVDGVVSVAAEKRACPHFEKGIVLDVLTAKFEPGEEASAQCEGCREGAVDRRGGRSKGKPGNSKSKGSVWVCLVCGQFSCGGVGLPTSAKSHALHHCRQTRHPLVVQLESPHLLWCFPCSSIIIPEKMEENEEQSKAFLSLKKLIKGHSANTSTVNVEDASMQAENISPVSVSSNLEKKRGSYVARGLVNLGNTCFFNSVVQNLLAMKKMRDYFLNLDLSVGPLTMSLKKIFIETLPESGLRSVINPRAFFGNVCTKSPQFRGFLQHDSHELLRCLHDGLSLEESAMRKTMNSSKENGNSSSPIHTFVDTVFGGQLSSTVCCLECGHWSTVYEPYLDLSLPVPTKKPTSKKTQQSTRSKKPKLPPKKLAKNRPKLNRSIDSVSDALISKDQSQSCSAGPSNCTDESTSVVQNLPCHDECENKPVTATEACENKQAYEDVTEQASSFLDDFSWLDYLEPEVLSDNNDSAVPEALPDVENKETLLNNISEQTVSESAVQLSQVDSEPKQELQTKPQFSSVNPWEDEPLPVLESWEALLLPYKEGPEQEPEPQFSLISPREDGPEQELDTQPQFSTVNPWEDEVLPVAHSSEVLLLPHKDEPEQEADMKPQYSSVNPWEDETLPVIQSSEVLLLPYIDNSSSAVEFEAEATSSVQGAQEDFDGFGAMFDEPEVFIGPVAGPGTGFMATNSSESDPDEVDDSDSPVSVETCLAHFTKPEILSQENAWHCENCSKSLLRQKSEASKQSKVVPETLINGCDTSFGSLSKFDSAPSCSNDQTSELVNESEDSSGSYHTCTQESLSDKATDSGCSACKGKKVRPSKTKNHKWDDSEEEDEVDSKKVKRDATKRVLINKAPEILTIHLKRFSQDNRGRLSKLTGHIAFGELVDLKPYVEPRCVGDERYDYRLVGVVEHQGNMRNGHYVAYVRGKTAKESDDVPMWYHASDAYVRETNLEEVLRCDAYILFYEKV